MVENPNGLPENHKPENNIDHDDEEIDEESINEDEDYPESEEFQAIDEQLNMLNSVLDNLEHKNDTIVAELTALLNENREIRKIFQQCQNSNQENMETNQ